MTKQKALEAVEEVVKDITRKMPTTTQIIKTERENIYNAIVEMVESEFMSTGEGVHEPYILGYNQALTDLKQNLQVLFGMSTSTWKEYPEILHIMSTSPQEQVDFIYGICKYGNIYRWEYEKCKCDKQAK